MPKMVLLPYFSFRPPAGRQVLVPMKIGTPCGPQLGQKSLIFDDCRNNEAPQQHYELARTWAKSVWEAWSHQHEAVADLIKRIY